MKPHQWPELSRNESDWSMPNMALGCCTDIANFLLGTIEVSILNLEKVINHFWEKPETQISACQDFIRVLYVAECIGDYGQSNAEIGNFLELSGARFDKTSIPVLMDRMRFLKESARKVVYNAFLIRPEYLLKSDDDMRVKPQILQDDVSKHFRTLKKAHHELVKQLKTLNEQIK